MVETFVEPSEWHSDKIDQVEKTIFLKAKSKISVEELYFQKSQTRIIKKLMQITQEVVNKISVNKETETLLQDVKDKILRLILIYDEAVEDTNNLMNTYLALTASKSNDVMKLLTIFSAFFLPLTFIVGLYGMNFDFMPELHWRYGYLYVIIFMILVSLIIYYWFKRKKII
jgi:magnesium transporter